MRFEPILKVADDSLKITVSDWVDFCSRSDSNLQNLFMKILKSSILSVIRLKDGKLLAKLSLSFYGKDFSNSTLICSTLYLCWVILIKNKRLCLQH